MGRNDGTYKRQGLTREQITDRNICKNKIFAAWIVNTFGLENLQKGTGILDIGGGNGFLALELWQTYGIRSTVIDPKPHLKLQDAIDVGVGFIKTSFDQEFPSEYGTLFNDCALLLGLHADGATEHIVDCGLTFGVPFAVIPCCCIPSPLGTFHEDYLQGERTYEDFVEYLRGKNTNLAQADLDLPTKRNIVVFSRPRNERSPQKIQRHKRVHPQPLRKIHDLLVYLGKIDIIT